MPPRLSGAGFRRGPVKVRAKDDERERDGAVARLADGTLDGLHVHFESVLERRDEGDHQREKRGPKRFGHETVQLPEGRQHAVFRATEKCLCAGRGRRRGVTRKRMWKIKIIIRLAVRFVSRESVIRR